jgi:hypothetical protein
LVITRWTVSYTVEGSDGKLDEIVIGVTGEAVGGREGAGEAFG